MSSSIHNKYFIVSFRTYGARGSSYIDVLYIAVVCVFAPIRCRWPPSAKLLLLYKLDHSLHFQPSYLARTSQTFVSLYDVFI